jgi:murein DD-endopeptidase MepM/ murein hydrolase activator NlpD/uncharacterized protein YraI
METTVPTNPYVGPRTYTRADRNLFFGREREARDLLARVISERLVLFYAQSGAGKSSLLNTSLIPGLQESGFAVLPIGRVSGELPAGVADVKNIYLFNLLSRLDQGNAHPAQLAELNLTDFLTHLVSEDGEHYVYDAQAVAPSDASSAASATSSAFPYVLIIDQFEEIITTHPARWPDREEFFRQLNQAMQADPNLWVVLTLREDYVAAIEPFAGLMADRMRARFYMQRMGEQAALEAVEKPAALGQRPFAPGVAQKLVDNLRQIRVQSEQSTQLGQYIEPVQLQVVCYQLWENLGGTVGSEQSPLPTPHSPLSTLSSPITPTYITAGDLDAAGDVDSALAFFYESAIATVFKRAPDEVSERALRNWFSHKLITEAGTRGTVYRGASESAELPNAVVDLLASQFLLRTELRAGGAWVELVHDRFVEPILQSNRAWLQRQSPLLRAAQEWDHNERDPARLLSPQQVELARSEAQGIADPLVADFLAASERAAQALAEQEVARRQQAELIQAQALARESTARLEAQQQRAAEAEARRREQAESASKLRRLLIGFAAAGIAAVLLAVWALASNWQARVSANAAIAARKEADQNAIAAETAEADAVQKAAAAKTAEQDALRNEQQANAARQTAVSEKETADAARAAAEAARATAEAESTAAAGQQGLAISARQTADALRNAAVANQEQLAQALAAQLTAQAPTPTATPAPLATPTLATDAPTATSSAPLVLPSPTPTPTPDLAATATTDALQSQLAQIQATQTSVAPVVTADLNVRSGPGLENPVLTVVKQGTNLEVLGREGDWLKVRADGVEGFVLSTYVSVVGEGIAPIATLEPPDDLQIPLRSATTNTEWSVVDRWNRFGGLLLTLASDLGIEPGVLTAVLSVQTGDQGIASDGRMVIRFEVHLFYNEWGRVNEERFRQYFQFDSTRSWTGHQWRSSPNGVWQEVHGSQESEWAVFTFASTLDDTAAKRSISMGAAQLMGFRHQEVGYPTVQEMFDAFSTGERSQLIGFFDLIANNPSLLQALRTQDFNRFATVYNGPGQATYYAALMYEGYQFFLRSPAAQQAASTTQQTAPPTPAPQSPSQAAPVAQTQQAAVSLALPFAGDYPITQRFGEYPTIWSQFSCDGVPWKGNLSLNFGPPIGTPILAAADGVVAEAAYDPDGIGNFVKLQHDWGESLYAGLESFSAVVGQTVKQGDEIGRSGAIGSSATPHLALHIRINPYSRADGWCGFSDPEPHLVYPQ